MTTINYNPTTGIRQMPLEKLREWNGFIDLDLDKPEPLHQTSSLESSCVVSGIKIDHAFEKINSFEFTKKQLEELLSIMGGKEQDNDR